MAAAEWLPESRAAKCRLNRRASEASANHHRVVFIRGSIIQGVSTRRSATFNVTGPNKPDSSSASSFVQ